MTGAGIAHATGATGARAHGLFDQIGEFLVAQRLAPDPVNYAFAHAVVSNPASVLSRTVASLTEGGVRLTLKDIESLGQQVTASAASVQERAQELVARTQLQVEGFADMVQGLRAETLGFGRDLAESAERMLEAQDAAVVDDIARIAAGMVERVQAAEAQLERATREADELREKLEEARDNAARDPLTGLPNRRAFEERFAAAAAKGETMWLAVCDVDHFKSVNDRFGHSVGDRVLRAIATGLTEACGEHLVARYGGEEFVVLFTGVDGNFARATLETARAGVESKRFRVRESDAPLGTITFSAGMVHVGDEESDRTAFGRADRLLYEAKNAGRNRVCVG